MMHQALLNYINFSKDASIDDLVDRLLVGLMQSAKHEGQTRSKILKKICLRIEHHINISDKENAEKQLHTTDSTLTQRSQRKCCKIA